MPQVRGGMFNGMMDRQGQTLEGKWSSLIDTVQQGVIDLYQGVNTPITEVVDMVTKAIPKIFTVLQTLFSAIASGVRFVIKFKTEFMILGSVIAAIWAIFRAYNMVLIAYNTIMTVVTALTRVWTGVQWLLNIALNANPIAQITIGIIALAGVIAFCWLKFAGFRAFLITMWDTLISFGDIIKNYLVNRNKELLSVLGLVGSALSKLFSGDFEGAAKDFGAGMKNLFGVNSATNALSQTANAVKGIGGNYNRNLAAERAKDKKSEGKKDQSALSTPSLKGSVSAEQVTFGKGKGKDKKKGRKSAEEIATGGTRSTSITMHIGKFFDTLQVHMTDKTDTAELERIVVQSMNRALAIATSTDRG